EHPTPPSARPSQSESRPPPAPPRSLPGGGTAGTAPTRASAHRGFGLHPLLPGLSRLLLELRRHHGAAPQERRTEAGNNRGQQDQRARRRNDHRERHERAELNVEAEAREAERRSADRDRGRHEQHGLSRRSERPAARLVDNGAARELFPQAEEEVHG